MSNHKEVYFMKDNTQILYEFQKVGIITDLKVDNKSIFLSSTLLIFGILIGTALTGVVTYIILFCAFSPGHELLIRTNTYSEWLIEALIVPICLLINIFSTFILTKNYYKNMISRSLKLRRVKKSGGPSKYNSH